MSQPSNLRPIYFYNVFWGKLHRESFLRECAASLLAPKNLPSLTPNSDNRYLIATTVEDWKAMEKDPAFTMLTKYIQTQFIEMPKADKLKATSPLLYMSAGHRILTEIMFDEKVWGIQTTPDSIFNDGFVTYIQNQIQQGKMLVLCPVSRFEKEGVNAAIDAGNWRAGPVLNLPSRDAVKIALKNMHSECLAANFDCDYFWSSPVYTWWDVPKEEGLVMHSMSWSPILMPYFALQDHDNQSLENWTIDGNYVYSNFNRYKNRIAIADDSDDAFILSVTLREQNPLPLDKKLGMQLVSRIIKCGLIRRLYYDYKIIDNLKREIYLRPIKWHSRSIEGSSAWKKKIEEARELIEFAVARYEVKFDSQMEIESYYVTRLSAIDIETVKNHKSLFVSLLLTSFRRLRFGSKVYYRRLKWRFEHFSAVIPLALVKIIANSWRHKTFQWPIIAAKASLGNRFYQYRINRRFKTTYPFKIWFLRRDVWK